MSSVYDRYRYVTSLINEYILATKQMFYILVFILSDFFLNVLILKLYKRNTDLQMDTQ